MNRIKIITAILIMFIFVCSCTSSTKNKLEAKTVYSVIKTSEEMELDGLLNEKIWQVAEVRSFDHFYRTESERDIQKSEFRMVWDDNNLYLFYEFKDKYLTARETKRDGKPFIDDCAEIFIIPAPDGLDSHIGIEVNINKAVNDFVYFNNFYENTDFVLKTFNTEATFAVSLKGTVNDNSDEDESWSCEMHIPLATFRDIWSEGISLVGKQWAFLAVRQDRNNPDGYERALSTLFPIYDEAIGVHQPKRFGFMEFMK